MGILLVHELRSARLNRDKLTQNASDWGNFVHAFPELAASRIEENQILGRLRRCAGCAEFLPLYLGKLITEITAGRLGGAS